MQTWVVIYQENKTREIFGWFCKAERPSEAEEKFWKAVVIPQDRAIRCIAQFNSEIMGLYFLFYEWKD